jgi:glutamine synthetase
LDGIKNNTPLPAPTNRNIYIMTAEEKSQAGIWNLPENLGAAIDALVADEVVREALGDHVFHHFVEAKRMEWDIYRTQISQWENDQYLSLY